MPGHLTTDTAPEAQRFTANAGVQIDATELQSPRDCFSVFFDEDVWKFLVEHTNQYATAYLANKVLKKRSLYINWKPVTVNEMKAFVAMILNMGIIQLPDLKDYWRKDETQSSIFSESVYQRPFFPDIQHATRRRYRLTRKKLQNRTLCTTSSKIQESLHSQQASSS